MGTHTITAKIFNSRQTCVGSFPFEYQDKTGDEIGKEYVKITSSERPRKRMRESDESSGQRKPTVRTSAL